jgi:hypothetical protein
MILIHVLVSVTILLTAQATFAQTGSTPQGGAPNHATLRQEDARIVGVWRAEADGLPWVTVTLTDEGGTLAGAVLFYLHRRDAGGHVTSTPGIPEPLLHPHFDGSVFSCEVSHRHAHPPESLSDPPVQFGFRLTSEGRASLGGATLVRSDY